MSRDYSRVILLGRLAKDPIVNHTQGGQKVARVSLAVGREWKDKVTGEKKSEADFHPVVAWGNAAGTLEVYCKKGKLLLIEGRLHSYSYDDQKTGVRKWVTEVVAENIIMMSDGKNSGQTAGAPAPSAQPQAQYYPSTDAGSLRGEAGFEDELDSFPLDFSELSGGNDDVSIPF